MMDTVTATMVGISECSSENGVFFYTIQVRHFLVGHVIYISLRGLRSNWESYYCTKYI